jgi:hypothetical protein
MKKKVLIITGAFIIVTSVVLFFVFSNYNIKNSIYNKFLLKGGYTLRGNEYSKETEKENYKIVFVKNGKSYYQICRNSATHSCFVFYWEKNKSESKYCTYDNNTDIINSTKCPDDDIYYVVYIKQIFESNLKKMNIDMYELNELKREFIK